MANDHNIDLRIFEAKECPCSNCDMYQEHGQNCWFYWQNKSECSQRK